MKTLALLLISLALAQAVTKPYRSPALNLIGTDAINDVIRYYNYFYKYLHAPSIIDLVAEHHQGQTSYYVRASKGRVSSGNVELVPEQAQLEFQFVPLLEGPPGSVPESFDRVVANFSITLSDMVLHYGKFIVEIKDGIEGSKAPTKDTNNEMADVIIEKNKFLLQAEQRHYKRSGSGSPHCLTKINVLAAEEFVVKNITTHSADPAMNEILEILANKFKAQILTGPYGVHVVESILKERAPYFLNYCQYVRAFPTP